MENGVMMFQPGGLVYKSGAGRYAQRGEFMRYMANKIAERRVEDDYRYNVVMSGDKAYGVMLIRNASQKLRTNALMGLAIGYGGIALYATGVGEFVGPLIVVLSAEVEEAMLGAYIYADALYGTAAKKILETTALTLMEYLPRSVVNSKAFWEFVKFSLKNRELLKDAKSIREAYRVWKLIH